MSKLPLVSHRGLRGWQLAMELAEQIYEATCEFPSDEKYGLTSQMRRAAVSIPSNIAEGYGRNTRGEYAQFIGIAIGSLRELETCLELAIRFGYVTPDHALLKMCDEAGRLLWSLRNSLRPKTSLSTPEP